MAAISYLIALLLCQPILGEQLRMKLFTPGPAVTSRNVKQALSDDVGIEEEYFMKSVEFVRSTILDVTGLSHDKFTAVPMQGTGTYSNEAAIRTATPKRGKVLVISNGFFGEELQKICKFSDMSYHVLSWDEGERIDLDVVERHLKLVRHYSTVVMVHFDTSTTMLNPITEVGKLMEKYIPRAAFVVDAIGSYGCFPFNFDEARADFITTGAHRCLQGFLGYAFVIARKDRLIRYKDNARTYALSIYDQWMTLENTRMFRFTSPAQVIVASKQALIEFQEEGISNRVQRFTENRNVIRKGMKEMGFVPFIPTKYGTSVVTAFYWPNNAFNFSTFQSKLEKRRTFIYPDSLTRTQLFRVGHIENISTTDCDEFLSTVKSVLESMNVKLPFSSGPYKTKT